MNINRYEPKGLLTIKHLTAIENCSQEDLCEILSLARLYKSQRLVGEQNPAIRGKCVALMCDNILSRTRISYEMSIKELGGYSILLPVKDFEDVSSTLNRDSFNVLKGYGLSAIVVNTKNEMVSSLVKSSTIPIINQTNDTVNPCQALSDLFTIWEVKGTLAGLKLAFIGDACGNFRSLMFGAVKLGLDVFIAAPEALQPERVAIEGARQYGRVEICTVREAVKNADVVCTYPFSHVDKISAEDYKPYRVTSLTMSGAKQNAIFMHPLPVKRDVEVDTDVFENSSNSGSVVLEQAINRIPVQKAILTLLIKKGK